MRIDKTTLLIMAAGMGSRFGGLKQIEPIGPNGEIILDYSIYDAKTAGFDKAVFIITNRIEKEFREAVGKRAEKLIDVEYAFQEISKPGGFTVPEGRIKPWGTAHAVLCAKDAVHTPFAVINADDFYGIDSFNQICRHLKNRKEMCMVGYKLGNTLTENGTVARGICEVENGYLKSVTERTAIDKNSGIPLDKTVSMNMWGFDLRIFQSLESGFVRFLSSDIDKINGEYYLPSVVDDMIRNGKEKVKVLPTNERWYGVTYREDIVLVKQAINKFVNEGKYNGM